MVWPFGGENWCNLEGKFVHLVADVGRRSGSGVVCIAADSGGKALVAAERRACVPPPEKMSCSSCGAERAAKGKPTWLVPVDITRGFPATEREAAALALQAEGARGAWLGGVGPHCEGGGHLAAPANRVCDAPGSWYCTGQYPPGVRSLIDKRKNFAQLAACSLGGSVGGSRRPLG